MAGSALSEMVGGGLPFSALPLAEAIARVAEIGVSHNMYFAPHDATTAAN
jgi:hypothetical protein